MNLDSPVSELPKIGPINVARLEKLGINTIENLLYHSPHHYLDFRHVTQIKDINPDEVVTIRGEIVSAKSIYTKHGKIMVEAKITDKTGSISAYWFNQPYLVRSLEEGKIYSFSGSVGFFNRKRSLVSPEFEIFDPDAPNIHTGRLVPIYPETRGIKSKWLRMRVYDAYTLLKDDLQEFIPEKVLKEFDLAYFDSAIKNVHFPRTPQEAEAAKRRLSFNELLFYQLKSLFRKSDWKSIPVTCRLDVRESYKQEFIKNLSFPLTKSQLRSIEELSGDLINKYPMNRLLEGDVGSGKTVIAAYGAFISFVNGFQSIIMAPTQILAKQHFDTLNKVFEKQKVRISLVTSAGVKSDLGKTDIFVGTHALIHKKVKFDKVAFVAIDEQHRFGVEQRAHLIQKAGNRKKAPHVLTMTATPIPRTIALTVYGELDLSTLDELPKGRKPVTTWIIPPQKRFGAYEWIKENITKERIQVFIICPLIEESSIETMKQVKAAKKEFDDLKKVFKGIKLGLLHGKQKAKEKEETLDKFRNGKIQILVATPVVEVGIDVPNATIMVIEAGERYGLSQLHQLRGRIGRGSKKSYCLVFTNNNTQKVLTRLIALKKSVSGFELAELDLKLRGPGDLTGTKQHGFPELKVASFADENLIYIARKVATLATDNPKEYSKLHEKIQKEVTVPN